MIRRMRKKLGLTQLELAKKVGVSHTTVVNWETKKSVPNTFSCMSLASLFGCSLDVLVAGIKESAEVVAENELYMGASSMAKRQVACSSYSSGSALRTSSSSYNAKPISDVCSVCGCGIDLCNSVDEDDMSEIYYQLYNRGADSLSDRQRLALEGICSDCYERMED